MSKTKGKLIVISAAKEKPVVNDELVSMLEQMLDSAKEGELTKIVSMLGYGDGMCEPAYSSGQDPLRIIGVLRIMTRELEDHYMGHE